MAYKIFPNRYSHGQNTRFTLGNVTEKTLVVFGINPSSADEKDDDRTIQQIISLAKEWQYDGWLMLNIYPAIETDPKSLPQFSDPRMVQRNEEEILHVLSTVKPEVIVAAWGNNIEIRPYLRDCLSSIVQKTKSMQHCWYTLGSLTKKLHPRHPLYLKKESRSLNKLDIKKYLENQQT